MVTTITLFFFSSSLYLGIGNITIHSQLSDVYFFFRISRILLAFFPMDLITLFQVVMI
jgi:hypothetical protein